MLLLMIMAVATAHKDPVPKGTCQKFPHKRQCHLSHKPQNPKPLHNPKPQHQQPWPCIPGVQAQGQGKVVAKASLMEPGRAQAERRLNRS